MINKPIICKFLKDFTNHRKKTNKVVVFCSKPLIQEPQMRPSNNLERKIPSDTFWKDQLINMKVEARNSLKPPLEYNQDQMPSTNQGCYDSFNQLGS